MKKLFFSTCLVFFASCFTLIAQQSNLDKVTSTNGLVAFWDFQNKNTNGYFVAHNDQYPIRLRNLTLANSSIHDEYTEDSWVATSGLSNIPVLVTDGTAPFGNVLKVDGRRLFANIERTDFHNTPLDISGREPFTLMAWVKFPAGSRKHHIVGIWDEGDDAYNPDRWSDDFSEQKYKGERQYALFRIGRYGEKFFGHISATGAASYPQAGQYARMRAINGIDVTEDDWHVLAMTYDGDVAVSYLDGITTAYSYSPGNALEETIYQNDFKALTNPKAFRSYWKVFDNRDFIVKFKGDYYTTPFNQGKVYEHYVQVDLKSNIKKIIYGVETPTSDATIIAAKTYQVMYKFIRNNVTIISGTFDVTNSQGEATLNESFSVQDRDRLELTLRNENGDVIGGVVQKEIRDGAPFSIGRIRTNGAQFDLDAFAMYNRALTPQEILTLGFTTPSFPDTTCENNDVKVKLQLDRYPDDNTWNIKNISGDIIFEYGPYNRSNDQFQLVNHDICLENGDYTFTLNDSYGDGASVGINGYIDIKLANGTPISFNDQSFTSTKSFDFSIGTTTKSVNNLGNGTDNLLKNKLSSITIVPNPVKANGVIRLGNTTGKMTYKIVDLLNREKSHGVVIDNSIKINQLTQGAYILIINSEGVKSSAFFVVE